MKIVSKKSHPRLWKPKAFSAINERLAAAVMNSREFRLGRLRLRCIQCHLGTGFYTPGHSIEVHQHNEAQFEIPLSGRFHFVVKETDFDIGPAQALFIPRATLHSWQTFGGGFMLGIQFSAKDEFGMEASLPTGRNSGGRVVANSALTAHLRQLIDLVVCRRSSALVPILSSSLLMSLIAEILDEVYSPPVKALASSSTEDLDEQTRGRLMYDQVCSFITSNLSRALTTKDITTQSGISFRHINRLFRKYSNESPHRAIMRLRLENAKAIIENSPLMPIKEIAFKCGFSSQAHLAVAFKNRFGISPSNYASSKVMK